MADHREARRNLQLRELAAYRTYKRTAERAQRNGASDSNDGDHVESEIHSTTPAEGADFRTAEEKIQHSTRENEVKSSGINEAAAEPLNLNTVASSSSQGSATEGATTTPVQTPPTETETAETQSTTPASEDPAARGFPTPQNMTNAEFHQALSVAFRTAGRPVPTPGQSTACYGRCWGACGTAVPGLACKALSAR